MLFPLINKFRSRGLTGICKILLEIYLISQTYFANAVRVISPNDLTTLKTEKNTDIHTKRNKPETLRKAAMLFQAD